MHPVKAVPTRYNPFVNAEKTHSSVKPVKTQKNLLGWAFLKKHGFFKTLNIYWSTSVCSVVIEERVVYRVCVVL